MKAIGMDRQSKSEGRMMEWQAIETAPKDGSKILLAKYGLSTDTGDLAFGSDEWKICFFEEARRKWGLWWCVAGHWSTRWNNWNDGVEPSGLADPTHWMPLPPPPELARATAQKG